LQRATHLNIKVTKYFTVVLSTLLRGEVNSYSIALVKENRIIFSPIDLISK
jgi:hypothetical protein